MEWDSNYVHDFVALVMERDRESSDLAAAKLLPAQPGTRAQIIAGGRLICVGLPLIDRIFRSTDAAMQISPLVQDGQEVRCNECVMELRGDAGAILMTEHTALSALHYLSGIATNTRRLAETLSGTRATICGPRNATPGMRGLEQYAIELGGGRVYRANDILLTTNHVRLAGGVKAALDQAHSLVALQLRPHAMTAYEAVGAQPNSSESSTISIQIEVQDQDELREALHAGAEFVILKNVRLDDTRHFVQVVREIRPDVKVQIEGQITVANARTYAEMGADYLCCEELTHPKQSTRFNLLVERREEK